MSAPRITRLLCAQCHELQLLKNATDGVATLDCGHQRPARTLPAAQGAISFEHLATQLGQELFPSLRENEKTSLPIWIEK